MTKKYKKILATYGTLRFSQSNYEDYLEGVSDYLGTIKTDSIYTMYSLGGFPAVAVDGNTAITVDLFGVDDDNVINRINSLEGYTGIRNHEDNWYDITDIETNHGVAEMFIMGIDPATTKPVIKNGDWVNRN